MEGDLARILLLLAAMAVTPLLLIRFGAWIVLGLEKLPGVTGELEPTEDQDRERIRVIVYFVVGLLAYLSGLLLLASAGCPFEIAAAVMYFPGLFSRLSLRQIFRALPVVPDAGFILWFTVNLIIGSSLFNAIGNISTIWINNYGDLTFHIGMITSFVFGNNFPVEMHLLAGEPMSYPIFVNLWTASLWQIYPDFSVLSLVFAYQWMLVWIPVYFLLNGRKLFLLPWALLLGGGAYDIVWRYLGLTADVATQRLYAHNLIDKNYPWTPFLTTIWVTQRSSLLGLLTVLAALRIFLASVLPKPDVPAVWNGRMSAAVTGLILGLSPLAHTHFCLLTGIFCGGLLLLHVLDWQKLFSTRELKFSGEYLRRMGFFCVSLLGLVFLPWLHSKANVIGLAAGWYPWKPAAAEMPSYLSSAFTWIFNAPVWLGSFVILALVTRAYASVFLVVILFLAGNVIKLSVWEWDQLKVFLAIYLIGLSIWAVGIKKHRTLSQCYLLLLILPCCFELALVVKQMHRHEVYTEAELKTAETVRANTPPNAIMLAKPDHNSPITLTGRRMFIGYDGTLASHGLEFQDRQRILADFGKVIRCAEQPGISEVTKTHCPNYLLWTRREQMLFSQTLPGNPEIVKPVVLPSLFMIQPSAPSEPR